MAGWMWKKQIESISSLRTIAVDLPDHGLDRTTPFMGIELVADELAASMLDSAKDIRNAIPGAKLEILHDDDHTYPWGDFEEYNRLLESWLR
jgi:hypothetical protein